MIPSIQKFSLAKILLLRTSQSSSCFTGAVQLSLEQIDAPPEQVEIYQISTYVRLLRVLLCPPLCLPPLMLGCCRKRPVKKKKDPVCSHLRCCEEEEEEKDSVRSHLRHCEEEEEEKEVRRMNE
ncbi:hypothetical protein QN277_010910 [Acacia crassicarpa]|uniref:Uncharacterized protein n=1 Tax=Acacia crassicarpa TaxID=499986 RepID=A0AAE1M4S6_9FABA|nr:hypothetical protein QN277_010910 [Acacia crassicarpa]